METQIADTTAPDGARSGTIVRPGQEGWEEARAAWNLIADQHPAAVAYVESREQIAAALEMARGGGLRVAVQGTGHGAGSRGPLADTLLIRTDRLTEIEIDPWRRTGRFGAGVIWRDAAEAAAVHGLAVHSGSSPDAGVVGYSTGGGFGWLARAHGLACNAIRAIELVRTDGTLRRVDAGQDPDLFWALRGGGGNFGVVSAIEFDLVPLAEVFAGSVIYPADDRSGEIFEGYRRWTETVPDEVTSIARFLHLPALPDVPEPLREQPVITLGACYAGDPARGEELIAPLRVLGEPLMDLFEAMAPPQLCSIHMEPEEPVPAQVFTTTLSRGPREAFEAFVEVAGPGSGSPLLVAELRHAGGVLASPAPGGGALPMIDGEFVFCGIGMPMGPGDEEAIGAQLDAICEALAPWSSGRRYFNFADRKLPAEALFGAETLRRLREVKRRFDPQGLIHGNHALDD